MINIDELDNSIGLLTPMGLALHWASRGVPVLPCNPETKAPWVGAKWEKKATRNPELIQAWQYKWDQGARVGIKTGLACGCGCEDGPDVLDFDVSEGKPGLEQLEVLLDAGIIDWEKAMLVKTPSGGRHAWFCGSDQHNKQNDDTVWGVDLRAHHGMVLAPGNPGYSLVGRPPTQLGPSPVWAAVAAAPGIRQKPRTTPLAAPGTTRTALPGIDAPPAAAARPEGYRSAKLVAPSRGFDDQAGEESPLDWYSRQFDVESVLLQHGWTFAYESQGRMFYVRPGKEKRDGVSGNVATMADGRRVFYNFSSSVDMPTDRAMSGGQLYAWLEHGGDMRSAAGHIRRTMMPRRESLVSTALPPSPVKLDAPVRPDAPPPPAETGGRDLVPITDTFWGERAELRNIRWLARERRASPWSVLGSVLALVSCRVGPHVVLPPIVGGAASLNLLVGLVGPSGKGKGASWDVAMEYLGYGDHNAPFAVEEISTPEGIDATFTETPPKSGPIQYNDVAFFYVPEVDRLKSQSENYALLSHLRKVYSGELLGGKTAAKERWRPVRRHAYRASCAVGIQPRRSGVILGDADGGLPQRFLWMPVHDPNAIRRTDKLKPPPYVPDPPQIEQDVWVPLGEQRGDKGEPIQVEMKPRWVIPVCRTAENEIIDAREENLVSEKGGLDSHALLTQLKTAALLAFLFGEYEVTDDHWRLARVIMKISDQTRDWCARELRDAEDEENANRGRARAVARHHEDISVTVVKDQHAERIAELGNKLLGAMQAEPGREWSPRQLGEILGDKKARDRYQTEVMAALVATPGVIQGPEITSGGRKIRKLSWHQA